MHQAPIPFVGEKDGHWCETHTWLVYAIFGAAEGPGTTSCGRQYWVGEMTAGAVQELFGN